MKTVENKIDGYDNQSRLQQITNDLMIKKLSDGFKKQLASIEVKLKRNEKHWERELNQTAQ